MFLEHLLLAALNLAMVFSSSPVSGLKILCLHGKGGNGARFRHIIEPLVERVRRSCDAEFIFVDAPNAISPDRPRLNRQPRSSATAAIGSGDFAWWTLPEGVRSYEANTYTNFDSGLSLVEGIVRERGVDLLLGHSQGAMMASVVLAKAEHQRSGQRSDSSSPLRGGVLSSAAWPLPFAHLFNDSGSNSNSGASSSSSGDSSPMLTLHTMSKIDKVNPYEHSLRIYNHFNTTSRGGAVAHVHEGGHVIPMTDSAMTAYLEFIRNVIKAKEKKPI